jgi:outer membrane protein assembly factor BamB
MIFKGPLVLVTVVGLGCILTTGCAGGLRLTPASTGSGDWRTEGGSEERANQVETTIALPLEVAWSRRLEALPGTSGPTIAGETILVVTRRGDLVAIDRESGAVRGRKRLSRVLSGSPLLVGDLAVLTAADGERTVIAYSLSGGRNRWTAPAGPIEGSAARAGETIIVASTDGHVTALALHDGEPLWTSSPDTTAGFFGSPTIADSLVIVADDRGNATAMRLGDGAERWRHTLDAPVYGTPVRAGPNVIFVTRRGQACALRLADGTRAWCYAAEDPLVALAPPAASDAVVVIPGTDGLVRALETESGRHLWTFRAPAGITAPPLLAGGGVFVGTSGGHLLAIDLASGELAWTMTLPGRVHAPPIPAGRGILVSSGPRQVTLLLPPQSVR